MRIVLFGTLEHGERAEFLWCQPDHVCGIKWDSLSSPSDCSRKKCNWQKKVVNEHWRYAAIASFKYTINEQPFARHSLIQFDDDRYLFSGSILHLVGDGYKPGGSRYPTWQLSGKYRLSCHVYSWFQGSARIYQIHERGACYTIHPDNYSMELVPLPSLWTRSLHDCLPVYQKAQAYASLDGILL